MWDCSLSYSLGWIQFRSLCFSFWACFVPFNPQPELVEVCSPWIPSVLSGRAELCWSEGIGNVLPRRGLGPAQMRRSHVPDETFVGWMLKQQCLTGHGACTKTGIIAPCLVSAWSSHFSQILDCSVQIAIPAAGKLWGRSSVQTITAPKRSLEMSLPAAGKWDLVLLPNCSSITSPWSQQFGQMFNYCNYKRASCCMSIILHGKCLHITKIEKKTNTQDVHMF